MRRGKREATAVASRFPVAQVVRAAQHDQAEAALGHHRLHLGILRVWNLPLLPPLGPDQRAFVAAAIVTAASTSWPLNWPSELDVCAVRS